MTEFLNANLGNILVVFIVIIAIIIGVRLGYIKQIKQILLAIVIEAESKFGEKTGKLKFAYVAGQIYKFLPSIARVFISVDLIEELINDAVEDMKDYLTENKTASAVVKSNNIK